MNLQRWLLAFLLTLSASSARAQFLGRDDAPSIDEEFLDADSATIYYARYSVGYSTISTLREFRMVVSQTFEKRFGASSVHSNAIAEGVPVGASFFRKQNRLFAYGASAFFSPVIRTSRQPDESAPPSISPNSVVATSSDAFFQSFSLEAVGEFRFKLFLLDFGVGVQAQRIGDKVQTAFYDQTATLIRLEEVERRAWIFSPTYFFAIGLDFFAAERISIVPMYKSFYWRYGNVKGSSDFFLLSLRTNL